MGNYIKIDRKILEWEWWSDINTCRLFIYMLLKANWKDGRFKGKEIPRGSFVSSIPHLSHDTNLTEREIRTGIKHLKATGEVTAKTYSKYTVFTVNNYNLYRSSDTQNDSQMTVKCQTSDMLTTDKRQTNDRLTTAIEEYKEGETREEFKQENWKEVDAPPLTPSQGEHEEKPKKENYKQLFERLLLDVNISDYLLEHVELWIDYKRKERSFTYKESSLRTLLKKIAEKSREYGEQAVATAIDESISSGYQGIVWDKVARYGKQSNKNDINASKQSQLNYLLDSIKREEEERNGRT